MRKAAWALQILLVLAFAGSGITKLMTSRAELLRNPMMGWAGDFTEMQIKLIGAAEITGAIGLVAPVATGIAPILTPIAALGLAGLMTGAVITHLQRNEPFVPPLVFLALLILAAYLFRPGLVSTAGVARRRANRS